MPTDAELSDLTVNEIMHFWPGTVRVFLDRNMLCIGCPIGGFHRLANAAYEHGIELSALQTEISRAIERDIQGR